MQWLTNVYYTTVKRIVLSGKNKIIIIQQQWYNKTWKIYTINRSSCTTITFYCALPSRNSTLGPWERRVVHSDFCLSRDEDSPLVPRFGVNGSRPPLLPFSLWFFFFFSVTCYSQLTLYYLTQNGGNPGEKRSRSYNKVRRPSHRCDRIGNISAPRV